CYNMTQTPSGWRENTPNIQIQAAAILTLAAEMWKDTDQEASKKWNNEAQKCLDRAWKWKLENGPFVYSYGSGVDADYFSHDARHLACIYRITGDARVAKALRDMAIIEQSITSWGQIISISSPWWKHTYDRHNKGERMLSEHILKLSGNPLYARMVQLDIKRNADKPYSGMQRDWLIAYYNGDLDEFKNQVATIKNTTGMSATENGPILRNDGFNVAMPWRSWCESTVGAVFSTPDAIESQLCSVIITAIEPDVEHARAKAHFPIAYSVVEMENPQSGIRSIVVADDFIAGATSFRPALAGPALPEFINKKNDSPWLRTDIWFANADGMAGVLELQALKDNSCTRVALWTHISEKAQINGAGISVKGMTVVLDEQFSGKIHNLGKTWGYSAGYYPLDLLEYVFKESANGFKQGETFATTVSVRRDGGAELKVGAHGTDGAIRYAEILKNGKAYVKLIFNSGKNVVTYDGMEIPSEKLIVLKLKLSK
ncbi:MAG: hypothetical protein JXR78_17850, partial [Victivallales bacterium]|nr:hypothetical protein [Victivallales bacterium]